LTSVHVFHRLVRLVRVLKFHVRESFVKMPVEGIFRHVDVFDGAVNGKDFFDVLLVDVSC